MFQLFQDIPEPIRQRTLQFQRLPGGRVDEPEPAGVQALAGQSGPWLFAAVHRIPQQRWPMEARWTRIWWVRPVSSRHSTWV